ncbi:MAG: GNAT family N-acetyltransferase [Coriobacteriia bacterium]
MHIRPADIHDAAAIATIYNHAVLSTTATFDTEPKTPEDRAAWLIAHESKRQHPVLVAEIDGVVAGWGSFSVWSDRCSYDSTVEMSVYLDPVYHRRGIGRALSQALLELAPEVGVHYVLGRICTENTASIALSESLGFSLVGVMHEVGRKFDRWLDVAMYELLVEITDAPGCG